jgi:hypothetical protein
MTATPSQPDQPAGTVRTVHGEPTTTEINEAGEAELARRDDTAANQPASSTPETRAPESSAASAPTPAPDEHEAKAPHRAKS